MTVFVSLLRPETFCVHAIDWAWPYEKTEPFATACKQPQGTNPSNVPASPFDCVTFRII